MSSIFAIGGIALWILVLSLPLLIYFLINVFQSEEPAGKNPRISLGEEEKKPESGEEQKRAG